MIIKNEKLKKAIITALADKEMLNILNASMDDLVSGTDIVKKFDIPHSTAYRKIKWMLDNDLLVVVKMGFTDEGKKYSQFRSTIRSVNVRYQKNEVTVESSKNVDPIEKTAENFFTLGDSNE
jgi:DNA-binding transcriptional ArsR family regulator